MPTTSPHGGEAAQQFVIAQGSTFAWLRDRAIGPDEAGACSTWTSGQRHGAPLQKRCWSAPNWSKTRPARIVWNEVFDEKRRDALNGSMRSAMHRGFGGDEIEWWSATARC